MCWKSDVSRAAKRCSKSSMGQLYYRAARPRPGRWSRASPLGCGSVGPPAAAGRRRERAMAEHWFSEDELEQMSRPTMDRAIEAIERGELEQAKQLCEEMKHEW